MIGIFKLFLEVSAMITIMVAIIIINQILCNKKLKPIVMVCLWALVLVRALLPFTLESPIHFFDFAVASGVAPTGNNDDAKFTSQTTLPLETSANVSDEQNIEQYTYKIEDYPDNGILGITSPVETSYQFSLWHILTAMWIIGMVVTLVFHIKNSVKLSRKIRASCNPVDDSILKPFTHSVLAAGAKKKPIRVFECGCFNTPAVWGCFRPRILIPPEVIDGLTASELDIVLQHEVGHIKYCDILLKYAWLAAAIIHWFNPLVWIAAKRSEESVDLARDRKVILGLGDDGASVYCDVLLKVYDLTNKNEGVKPTLVSPLFGQESQLKKRIVCHMNSKNEKKFFIVLSVFLASVMAIACFTTACQPTPEKPPIIGRQEDILEVAKQADFEQLDVPEHYSQVYDGFSMLKVTFDADIIVPDTTAYPLVEVSPRLLTDSNIKTLLQLCVGSSTYDLYSEYEYSKEELRQMLSVVKQYNGIEGLTDGFIAGLQEMINKAPVELKATPVDVPELQSKTQQMIYVKYGDENISPLIVERDGHVFWYSRSAFMSCFPENVLNAEQFDDAYQTQEQFLWYRPNTPEITQDEAYAQALNYLSALDIDLELYSAELCTVLTGVINKTTGWQFIFTRTLSGLQSHYNMAPYLINPDALPSYAAPWPMEIAKVVIDKDGLCEFQWQGGSEVNKTAIEYAKLETFDFIQERIAKQLNYVYGAHESISGAGLDIEVTRIELGVSLMSLKDKPDKGIYIPTWYVSFNRKWSDSEEYLAPLQIIFSAIDGSYIEPRVTNQELLANAQP